VEEDVRARLSELPEVFTRRDVCRVLGYEPERTVLHRVLKKLVEDELTHLEFKGDGQRPAKYRKTGAAHSPGSA
jgi:prophage antirepressor-like protein